MSLPAAACPGPRLRCAPHVQAALVLVAVALLGAVTASAAAQDAGHPDLPAEGEVAAELYATGFAPPGGIALDRAQNLFAANYRALGTIGRVTADGTASVYCDLVGDAAAGDVSPLAGAIKVDRHGDLVVADAGRGRLLKIAREGKEIQVLADRCEGTPFASVVDVALDHAGGIFLSVAPNADQPGGVFRYVLLTRKVTPFKGDIPQPAGLLVTKDQNHVCIGDAQSGQVWICRIDAGSGMAADQRRLVSLRDALGDAKFAEEAQPLSMAQDDAGRIYIATGKPGVVAVIDPATGRLLGRYWAGGEDVRACHFGGEYLYTAVAAKEAVFRLKLNVRGFDYSGATLAPAEAAPPSEPE